MATRRHVTPLRVTAEGYVPDDAEGRAYHAKLKPGQIVGAEIARSRSLPQHKLYWSVLTKVVETTGDYPTPEKLHLALKVHLGFVEKVRLINGKMVLLDSSTAFDAMNQTEFQSYIDSAFRTIETDLLGGMSIDEFMSHADNNPSTNAAARIMGEGNWG